MNNVPVATLYVITGFISPQCFPFGLKREKNHDAEEWPREDLM